MGGVRTGSGVYMGGMVGKVGGGWACGLTRGTS